MTPFAILAPNLTDRDTKLLRAALTHVRLPIPVPVDVLPDSQPRHILSVGKAALDIWHDFGLIQVGANHGDVFVHRRMDGRHFFIMVLEHPGAMDQLSAFGKYSAREDMVRDLTRWRLVLESVASGKVGTHGWHPGTCGGCLKRRGGIPRPAEHWVDEMDGVGLCEDHYRRRGRYNRKRKVVPVKDRGKIEHQIEGQREMFGGDGTRVMVDKK